MFGGALEVSLPQPAGPPSGDVKCLGNCPGRSLRCRSCQGGTLGRIRAANRTFAVSRGVREHIGIDGLLKEADTGKKSAGEALKSLEVLCDGRCR